MARIAFCTAEGEERSYKLDKHRLLRIGRDPGNDIVLRDARVSRQHAEIAFERGFFVLRDLTSANGTFVNGHKVRVAPLTEGAQLRLGSTTGKFTEELVTELPLPVTTIGDATRVVDRHPRADARPEPRPEPRTEPLGPAAGVVDLVTLPHEKITATDLPRPEDPPLADSEDPGPFEPGPVATLPHRMTEPESDTAAKRRTHLPAHQLPGRLVFETTPRLDEVTVRDGAGKVMFRVRRTPPIVSLTASLVAWVVLLAGAGATAMLYLENRPLHAVAAIVLTLLFSVIIFILVPRHSINVFEERSLWAVAEQTGRLAPRFTIRTPGAEKLAELGRSMSSRVAPHRWTLLDRGGHFAVGEAVEAPAGRAMLRKPVGTFFGVLRTHFEIAIEGKAVARLMRVNGLPTLDIFAPDHPVDPRVLVSVAAILQAFELRS